MILLLPSYVFIEQPYFNAIKSLINQYLEGGRHAHKLLPGTQQILRKGRVLLNKKQKDPYSPSEGFLF